VRKGRHGLRLHPERAPQGERNGNALFTDDDIREMRRRKDTGERQKDIAAAFGTTPSSVSLIVRRKQWAHVT
jgi:hypothetical protein